MDDWFRVLIMVLALTTVVLIWIWMRPRMKRRLLTPGEVLTRTGTMVLLVGTAYGVSEFLFHYSFSIRVPVITVAVSWLFIGMVMTLRQGVGVRGRVDDERP